MDQNIAKTLFSSRVSVCVYALVVLLAEMSALHTLTALLSYKPTKINSQIRNVRNDL